MNRYSGRCATILVLCVLGSTGVQAANVGCNLHYGKPFPDEIARKIWPSGARPTKDSCQIGALRGEITKGDYSRVLDFYRLHHPFLRKFLLDSPGGNVREAIKIGRLFRKYLIGAEAPKTIAGKTFLTGYAFVGRDAPWNISSISKAPDAYPFCWDDGMVKEPRTPEEQLPPGFVLDPVCICASACALIWFGSPERSGKVGLHRPRFTDPSFGKLSPNDAEATYKSVLRDVSAYLDMMGAPKSVIEQMVTTQSADIVWVEDGVAWGETRIDRAPSFSEWADSACGSFSTHEYLTMIDLGAKKWDKTLPSREERQYQLLNNKYQTKNVCEHELMSSSRDSLPRP